MTPTPEQQAVIDAARSSKDSLLINALAGAAKTTTLCLLAQALPLQPGICVAFNKAIATEMAKRLPAHIAASTLNSLGHRVWGQRLGRKLQLDTDKGYTFLKSVLDKSSGEDKRALGENMAGILRAVRFAKAQGYIPPKFLELSPQGSLLSWDQLAEALAVQIDLEPDAWLHGLIDQALEHSIAEAFSGKIDFDDQIYMSTLFGGSYPRYPIVLVDEAQDLSALNHETLKLLVAPGGRLIAVGDPWQSIYAFRGAHHGSMEVLRETFSMKELNLSVTFRCPQRVVERARSRVPHFQWADGAPLGVVERLHEWEVSSIPDGAAVICRNNAPLFSLALRLIRERRTVKLWGNEIGKGLIKILKSLGPLDLPAKELREAIKAWQAEQLAKVPDTRHGPIYDKAECLLVFAEAGPRLSDALTFAELLFSSEGRINLMSGHKSKGLEFDIVYHLDPFRIPGRWAKEAEAAGDPGPMAQELNIRYVIETRAKRELYLVNLEDLL